MRLPEHQELARIRAECATCASLKALADELGITENMLRKRAAKLGVYRDKKATSLACSNSAKRTAKARAETVRRERARFVVKTDDLYVAFARMVAA